MIFLIDNRIDRKKWSDFFFSNQFATPFQAPAFYDFFNSVPGNSAKAFAIEENNQLKALCVVTFQKEKGLKGYFSRRAIIYGGPLLDQNSSDALEKLISLISAELKHKVIYIETRNFNDYSQYKNIFLKDKWQYIPYLNYQIHIKDRTLDKILSQIKYNRRREIKLSIKEGSVYGAAANAEEAKALYNILADLYKQRVKLPLPDYNFFEKLFYSPVGKVFIVKHNNQIIGGAFCIYFPSNTIFTLYYCGLREYNKKIFPTHLAILAAIEFAVCENLTMLDMMGAGKPDEEYGVRNYKAEFGGELVHHGRFLKINNPVLYQLGKTVLALLAKIKK
jgi:serine/alanine adding enzyme